MYGERSNTMLEFRKLYASEIEARVARVSQYGVDILLYKDARCDMNLLDEAVGPENWQKSYSRDNANCTVSIWDKDKKQWISKEDTGTESNTEKEKGLASDSFKRACVNWGIGRELYTAPRIFFWSKDLHNVKEKDGKYVCHDRFSVSDIKYTDNGMIKTVTISVSDNKGAYLTKTFASEKARKAEKDAEKRAETTKAEPAVAAETEAKEAEADDKPVSEPEKKAEIVKAPAKSGRIKAPIADDTVIIIGNSKGKTFGEVKNTPVFLSFLKALAAGKTENFSTEEEQEQYTLLKKLGEQIYGAKKSA